MEGHMPLTSQISSPQAYLLHCVRISLKKRWPWAAGLSAGMGLIGSLLHLNIWWIAALVVLSGTLCVAGIAMNSWRRHRHDLHLHTVQQSTVR